MRVFLIAGDTPDPEEAAQIAAEEAAGREFDIIYLVSPPLPSEGGEGAA